MGTHVRWKVFARLGRDVSRAGDLHTIACNATPGTRIYSQFSLALSHAYVPLTLIPSATYYQYLNKHLLRSGLDSGSIKFPYEVEIDGSKPWSLSLQARLYPPRLVALTVRMSSPTSMLVDPDFVQLFDLRNLGARAVQEVVRFTVGILDSGNHKSPTSSVRLHAIPGFHVTPVAKGEAMPAYVEEHTRQLVALLLGVRGWHTIEDSLVEKTMARNKELNVKNRGECLLVNKQGLIFLSPAEEPSSADLERFARTLDLMEIAQIFQMFLTDFPQNRPRHEEFTDYIYSLIRAWLRHPAAILSASHSNRLAWDLVVDALGIGERLRLTEAINPDLIRSIERKEALFAQISNRWWESPDFAAGFDLAAMTLSKVLRRLKDTSLRASILEDLREAETSLSAQNFKAAVVMSGAAVEAMLLGLLEQETTLGAANLRSKGLHDYLELARTHRLISDTAMLDLLDNTLREWRNYVHPGKALRTGVVLTSDHAKIVVTAASALAKSLQ
jgi:hypothetical protein